MNEMYDETGVPWGAASPKKGNPLSGPTPMVDAYIKSDNETDECIGYANWAAFAKNLERLLAEAVGVLEHTEPRLNWNDGVTVRAALARIKAAKEQV